MGLPPYLLEETPGGRSKIQIQVRRERAGMGLVL